MIGKNPVPGAAYLYAYLPALLEPGRYHADGQTDESLVRMAVPRALRAHCRGVMVLTRDHGSQ